MPPLSANPKPAYSLAEFCELISLSRSRVLKEIREYRLRAVKVGRRVLIPTPEVAAWLERLVAAQKPVPAKA